jgi:hypothetical protein
VAEKSGRIIADVFLESVEDFPWLFGSLQLQPYLRATDSHCWRMNPLLPPGVLATESLLSPGRRQGVFQVSIGADSVRVAVLASKRQLGWALHSQLES